MSAVAPDPAVAAAAAQLAAQAAEEQDPSAPYGRDAADRPNVPGFVPDSEITVPADLAPTQAPAGPQEPAQSDTEAPESISLEADLSGIEDLLSEPDLVDEPVDEEPDFSDEDEPEDGYVDTDPKLLKRLKTLEKKNQWLEEQRVKHGQKNWREEAKRRFPLAATAVDEISETSRKATLRKAQELHNMAAKILKPHLELLQQGREAVMASAEAEGKARAVAGWGKPTSGPPQPMIEQATAAAEEAKLDRRNYKNLTEYVTALMRAGKIRV